MALNALRGRARAALKNDDDSLDPMPIGHDESEIFSCPTCNRPLATGTARCPGCGTMLLLGVAAKRASLFVTFGVLIGLVLGAGVAGTMFALEGSPAGTRPVAGAGSGSGSGTGSGSGGSARIPSLAKSALSQTVVIDTRLAAQAATLQSALKARHLDVGTVQQTLRTMAADAATGLTMTGHLARWDKAATLSADLTAIYRGMRDTASSGLAASVRNEKAYRTAADRMVKLVAGLPALDTAARDLAKANGIKMPAAPTAP